LTTINSIGDIIREVGLLRERQDLLEKEVRRRMDRFQRGTDERNRRLQALLKLYPEGPAWELGTKLKVPRRPRNLRHKRNMKKEAT